MKIGITGNEGFVGKHLTNTIRLFPDEFEVVPFSRNYFEDESKLQQFAADCDVIIHLAALNRHNDPDTIYKTNIELVEKLVKALEAVNSKAHVLFSSSSQEERDNVYGKSKKAGRELFVAWAKRSGGKQTSSVMSVEPSGRLLPTRPRSPSRTCQASSMASATLVNVTGLISLAALTSSRTRCCVASSESWSSAPISTSRAAALGSRVLQ